MLNLVTNVTSYNRVAPCKAVVFKGKANQLVLAVDQVNPRDHSSRRLPWIGVTRMVLHVVDFNETTGATTEIVATADTDDEAALIDYGTDGQLTLSLGSLTAIGGGEIPAGEYMIRLTQYVADTATQILHESGQIARLVFVDVDDV